MSDGSLRLSVVTLEARFRAGNSEVEVLVPAALRGVGAAVRAGLEVARGAYFAVLARDSTLSIAQLTAAVAALEARGGSVLYVVPSRSASVYERVVSGATRAMFGLDGVGLFPLATVFRTEFLRTLPFESDGEAFASDVAALTAIRGVSVHTQRVVGSSRRRGLGEASAALKTLAWRRLAPR